MKLVSKFLLAIVLTASVAQGQQMRSATWSTDRFILRYRTMLEPPRPGSPELNIGGGGADDATTNHRILTDPRQKKYFGYDLQVDPLPDGRFSVTFKPLSIQPDKLHWPNFDNSWSQIPLPAYPASVQVRDGETIALDLLVNASSGQKIVEYVTVNSRVKNAAAAPLPRDLQVSDVHMSLESPRLQINGKHWDWNRGDAHGGVNGPVVWIYLPDRGRFLFSFKPHDGYRKAGEVRGKVLTFNWNNENYELQTQGNILPGDGAFNVYVSADAAYRPEYPPAQYGALSQAPIP